MASRWLTPCSPSGWPVCSAVRCWTCGPCAMRITLDGVRGARRDGKDHDAANRCASVERQQLSAMATPIADKQQALLFGRRDVPVTAAECGRSVNYHRSPFGKSRRFCVSSQHMECDPFPPPLAGNLRASGARRRRQGRRVRCFGLRPLILATEITARRVVSKAMVMCLAGDTRAEGHTGTDFSHAR
jgi:hypothetical protein